jgi:hypothetical protein
MRRLIKWILVLAVVFTMVAAASYAGARARAGQLLGNNPPAGGRTITFEFGGIQDLPDRPRGWVFNYSINQLGVRRVRIYISPSGEILGTVPRNLDQRVEAYERSREP